MPSILVLDDDSDIRAVLRLRFESLGWCVSEARDGKEALEMAKQQSPDVIILDWMTPGLTGIEVLAGLRRHGPIISISPQALMRFSRS
jgi:two-component system phosphate regulon response regulator PhoB